MMVSRKVYVSLMGGIIPQVIFIYSPTTSIMILSNPADTLTAVCNKNCKPKHSHLEEYLERERTLNTSRLKTIIANSAGID